VIKLAKIEVLPDLCLRPTFTDGRSGIWDARPLLTSRATVLTTPLLDQHKFARAFIDAGALAWPNGLEFSGHTLHARLAAEGALVRNEERLPLT
jgi:hypothetical protein